MRRQRGTPDRRAVKVELTRAGHALHGRLLKAVIDFDQQLRAGLSGENVETLRRLLGQLQENVGARDAAPRSGPRANLRDARARR